MARKGTSDPCNTIRPTIREKGTSDPCNIIRPTIREKGTSDPCNIIRPTIRERGTSDPCNTIRLTIREKGTSDPCNTIRLTIRANGTSDPCNTIPTWPSAELCPRALISELRGTSPTISELGVDRPPLGKPNFRNFKFHLLRVLVALASASPRRHVPLVVQHGGLARRRRHCARRPWALVAATDARLPPAFDREQHAQEPGEDRPTLERRRRLWPRLRRGTRRRRARA